MRRLEACQSPVWDTVLAMIALADAGLPADHPALLRAAGWVLDEEIRGPGDWQVRRPGLAPGGWAFEFDNDGYPDIDDTAEVLLALRRVATAATPRSAAAVQRGVTWLTGMQSKDGGWAAFDADNTSGWSPSCRSATSARSSTRRRPTSPRTRSRRWPPTGWPAARRCAAVWPGCCGRRSDGSWFGRWGANYVYGTGAVVPA